MPHYRNHPQPQWHPQHSQRQQHPQQNYPGHQGHQGHQGQRQVQSQGYPGSFPVPREYQMSRQLTIEDAIGIARGQVTGQVVQAELERRGGRLIYEVDIISEQGPKYEVKIDATTGEVIEVELD